MSDHTFNSFAVALASCNSLKSTISAPFPFVSGIKSQVLTAPIILKAKITLAGMVKVVAFGRNLERGCTSAKHMDFPVVSSFPYPSARMAKVPTVSTSIRPGVISQDLQAGKYKDFMNELSPPFLDKIEFS